MPEFEVLSRTQKIRVRYITQSIILGPNNVVRVVGGRSIVTVTNAGPIGPPGLQGPPGDDNLPPYHHVQEESLSVWTINHNRNSYPVPVFRDDAGNLMIAHYAYQSLDQITVSFPSPRTGTADLIF